MSEASRRPADGADDDDAADLSRPAENYPPTGGDGTDRNRPAENHPPAEGARPELHRRPDGIWCGAFFAMASPCELLVDTDVESIAHEAFDRVVAETARIERKFSRYRDDSVIAEIHAARGARLRLDEETCGLLAFAEQAHALSGGLFDITSGVLRQVWSFAPGARLPDPHDVGALLPRIGWQHVVFTPPWLELPEGMEIDLGGIGKEYAVDRAVVALEGLPGAFLVNLGGDLRAATTRPGGAHRWLVGIESPDREDVAVAELSLEHGALATSGDARRAVLRDGVRYGHVFDPRTGWPVPDAPRAVTVHAPTCLEAGTLATLALLEGKGAEAFLAAQGVPHWCYRDDVSSSRDHCEP